MQVAANAIVDIIAPAPNAAAARTTALAGMNFGRVLQSILQAEQENSLDMLVGGPDANATAAPLSPLALNLTAPSQTPPTPGKRPALVASIENFGLTIAEAPHGLSEQGAAPPDAPALLAGQRGASPPSFSLPQQAASPLHAPEWTPPGSVSATAGAGAAANSEPNPIIPQTKAIDPPASAQLVPAHARPEPKTPAATPHLEPTAPSPPAHLFSTLQATAVNGLDAPTPLGAMKIVDTVQSPPAQTLHAGVELPIASAAASMATAAPPPSLGAKLTHESLAPPQQPIEAPPATLIAGRGAEPLATRKAPPDGRHARDAAFPAQKEAAAPNAPNAVLSTAAQALAKESGQPTFTAEPSPQVQLASAPTATSHAALAAAVHEHAARAAPAAAQVAREIVRRFDGETTRFELRLDPPELGRVEVRLEVTRDHRVSAIVAADTPQALSELARHARDLEQTLQSAGLQLNENGLSFDLRQSDAETAEAEISDTPGADGAREDELPAQILARPIGLERWRGVRLDVVV